MKVKSRTRARLSHDTASREAGTGLAFGLLPESVVHERAKGARGSVFLEYLAVTIFVTTLGAAAVIALGVPLAELYLFQQMIVALPIP
jgi:hypothetical protein